MLEGIKLIGDPEPAPLVLKSVKETLHEKKAEVAKLKAQKGMKLSIKAPATMLVSSITPAVAGAAPYIVTTLERGITLAPHRQPFLREISNTKSTKGMYVAYAEQFNVQGAVTTVLEGAAKPQVSWQTRETVVQVSKVPAFIKVSREILKDVEDAANEFESELRLQVELKLDQELYNGSGVYPELMGVYTAATAFNAGSYAATVDNASIFDVITVAAAQIAQNGFTANYALVNPQTLAKAYMKKTTDGRPIYTMGSMDIVAGVRIVTNPLVGADEYVVGDFTRFNVRIREEFGIELGTAMSDYTSNLINVEGEIRACSFIKNNENLAFVKGSFSTSQAALETP